jgi:hypothetical protein
VCHIAKAEGNNISTRAAESEGMTSETWPPPRSDEGNFPPSLCKFKSDFNVLKGSYECISYLLSTIVPDDEIDIDALDGFVKGMRKLHPKPEGENPECFCGDAYKLRCWVTTRLCGSGFGCVIISRMILNRAIRRYCISIFKHFQQFYLMMCLL